MRQGGFNQPRSGRGVDPNDLYGGRQSNFIASHSLPPYQPQNHGVIASHSDLPPYQPQNQPPNALADLLSKLDKKLDDVRNEVSGASVKMDAKLDDFRQEVNMSLCDFQNQMDKKQGESEERLTSHVRLLETQLREVKEQQKQSPRRTVRQPLPPQSDGVNGVSTSLDDCVMDSSYETPVHSAPLDAMNRSVPQEKKKHTIPISKFSQNEKMLIVEFVDAKRKELGHHSDQETAEACLHILPDEKYKSVDKRRISEWRNKLTAFAPRSASRTLKHSTKKRDDQIESILGHRLTKIRSVSHAHFMVMSAWQKKEESARKAKSHRGARRAPKQSKPKRANGLRQPCRTTVYRYLISHDWKRISSGRTKKSLSPEEITRRTTTFRAEVGYLVEHYNIPINRIFNADETSYKLIPSFQFEWALHGKSTDEKIMASLNLAKAHTTVLCACSADGRFLDPQINLKGGPNPKKPTKKNAKPRKSRLIISDAELGVTRNDGKPYVRQFVQYTTHWTTQESFLHYVETVIYPAAHANGGGKDNHWLLIIDVSGIHVALAFRLAFEAQFGQLGGILMFIPPSMTDMLQPLDISVFGPYKGTIKTAHWKALTTGKYQHRKDDKRQEFLRTSPSRRSTQRMGRLKLTQ